MLLRKFLPLIRKMFVRFLQPRLRNQILNLMRKRNSSILFLLISSCRRDQRFQTALLEYKIERNDASLLSPQPYNLGPILEETAQRQIQEYMDASETFYENLHILEEVFRRIRGVCVGYVGLLISNEGHQPKDTHKNRIVQCSVPEDVNILTSFLALCSYCKEILSNLSTIAQSLQKFLRKGSGGEPDQLH